MELSSIICLIVCVALNWGASALIVWKIQKAEQRRAGGEE